jgi:hypothetical protein
MTIGTPYVISGPTTFVGVIQEKWLDLIVMSAIAAFYVYMLARAANWCGRTERRGVRGWILGWAWLNVVVAGCFLVGTLHVIYNKAPQPVVLHAAWFSLDLAVLVLTGWIGILLMAVKKPGKA